MVTVATHYNYVFIRNICNLELAICSTVINPLSLKSDQLEISPCKINALQNRLVMRTEEMITEDESSSVIIHQTLPLLLLKTYRGNI